MLKRIILALLIFIALTVSAEAAQVTVSAITIPAWARVGNDVELRIYVDTTFASNPDGTLVISGAPGGFQNYRTFTCTVGGSPQALTINSGTLFSTTDGKDLQTSRYTAYLVQTTTGIIIQPFLVQFKLPPTPNPATWTDIINFNSSGAPIPIDRDTYSKTQVNDLIQQFKDSLMVSGIVTPATGGTGLAVTNQSGFLVALTGTFSLRTITDADVPDTITVTNYQLLTGKGAASGYAPLDGSSLVPVANIPNLQSLNGVLTGPKGGTSFSSYSKGDTIIADAGGNLTKLTGDNTGTKKFYSMTSQVASYATIAGADLPLGLSSTPTLNAVPNGDGANYSITTTPTIAGLTTTAVAAITVGANGGSAGEFRLKDADGTAEYFGFKGSAGRSANLVVIMPTGNPSSGDTLVFGTPSGGSVTTSFGSPTVPGTGVTTVKVDGSTISAANVMVNFLGSTSTGTIGGVGPFVGDVSGADDRVAIRTSPDSSTILVGTGRTIATTAPLAGGGDLSANRTLSISISPGGATTVVGTTRALSSSGGTISGTGDLSADRNLAVVANKTQQRVGIRANSNSDTGSRAHIKFVDSATITVTATDLGGANDDGATDAVSLSFAVATSSSNHNFLSATHADTTAHALTAGDDGGLIRVNAGHTAYEFFKPSGTNQAVFFNGTNTVFGQIDLSTSIVTSRLPAAAGGTGVDGSLAGAGNLLIGNGAGYTLGTLTGTAPITVTNGPGAAIAIGVTGTIVTSTDDTQYLTVSGGKVNLATNPGAATNQQWAIYPDTPFGSLTVGIPNGSASADTDSLQLGVVVYLSNKVSFNRASIKLTTVGGVAASASGTALPGQASVGVYSANGVTRYATTETVAVGISNTIGAVTGVNPGTGVKTFTAITGAACPGAACVSAGTLTMQPGYYLLVFTASKSSSTGFPASKGSAPSFEEQNYTTASILDLFQNAGSIFYTCGVTTGGAVATAPLTVTGATTAGNFTFPVIKFSSQ